MGRLETERAADGAVEIATAAEAEVDAIALLVGEAMHRMHKTGGFVGMMLFASNLSARMLAAVLACTDVKSDALFGMFIDVSRHLFRARIKGITTQTKGPGTDG